MKKRAMSRLSIYLVDDNPIVIYTIKRFLTELGHEVTVFNSVADLFEYETSDRRKLDIMLLDLDKGSGLTLIHEIHERYPDTDIVITTETKTIFPAKAAIMNRIYSYLYKPISFNELELMLVRAYESRNISNNKSLSAGQQL